MLGILTFPSLFTWTALSIGMMVAAFMYADHAVVYLGAGIGLWMRRRWGWAFAVFASLSLLVGGIRGLYAMHKWKAEFELYEIHRTIWHGVYGVVIIMVCTLLIYVYTRPSVLQQFRPSFSGWKLLLFVIGVYVLWSIARPMGVNMWVEMRLS